MLYSPPPSASPRPSGPPTPGVQPAPANVACQHDRIHSAVYTVSRWLAAGCRYMIMFTSACACSGR